MEKEPDAWPDRIDQKVRGYFVILFLNMQKDNHFQNFIVKLRLIMEK